MARAFSKAFYNSKEWKQCREYCLKRDRYLCKHCGDPAEEVHHKIHLTPSNINNIQITLNPSNLVSLCKPCHFAEHYADKGAGHKKVKDDYEYEFDKNGMLVRKSTSPRVVPEK